MKLSAPKQVTWWIAVVIAAISALSQYGVLSINLGISNYVLMLIAFVIMLLGTMLKGF